MSQTFKQLSRREAFVADKQARLKERERRYAEYYRTGDERVLNEGGVGLMPIERWALFFKDLGKSISSLFS